MARPQKKGLDYFSLDCHMNDEVGLIVGDYGMEGFGVLIQLFQVIYGNEGYFMNWGKKEQKLFSYRVRVDLETVVNIANDCLEWDIFSSDKHKEFNILTSHRIQEHYMVATHRRKDIKMLENYSLLGLITTNVDNNRVNVDNNPPAGGVSDDKSAQSILNNIKPKETIKDIPAFDESKPTPAKVVKLFNEICIDLRKCKKLTTERTSKINARIKELKTMEEWENLFKAIQDTPFCKGNNNRGWKADIDWIIKNDGNYTKVLEGKYNYGETQQQEIQFDNSNYEMIKQQRSTPEEKAERKRKLEQERAEAKKIMEGMKVAK